MQGEHVALLPLGELTKTQAELPFSVAVPFSPLGLQGEKHSGGKKKKNPS